MTAKYGIPYFSNYVNSDMNPSDIRSMCPVHKDTCVCIKDTTGNVTNMTIEEVYNTFNGMCVDVLTPDGWCSGKPTKMPNTDAVKVVLENGVSAVLGVNHLQPTKDNGTITVDKLQVGMRIPCVNKETMKTVCDDTDNLPFDFYAIVSVDSVQYQDDLYCFEVDNTKHLFVLSNGLITHNCRLRLDLRELRRKSGGYFGSGDSTGSIGVVTINMPRLAYTSKDEAEFYTKLDKLMDIAARSLETKRKVVSQFLEEGLYPYTKRYLGKFDNHFSTIGLVGMNEACLNAAWIKDTIASEAGYRFSCAVLDHMRNKLSDYQEKYGNLFNLEATPAESTSYRFAKHDVEAYPDIITAGTKTGGTPYYTNSSHLPVDFTEDIFTALDIQDGLQTKYTSGTVFHAFLGEKLPSWQSAMKLTRTIAENYRLPYFTFSPTYSVCKNHGYIAGEHFTCPECGEVTEVYSRITGYYRAVQYFNDGKAQEYKDRTEYVINSIPEKFNTEDTHDESPYPTASVKKITLFATTTCPNCAQAKKQLTAAGIDYDVVIADGTDPVGTQLAIDCGVKQAPTLVLPTGEVISNVSNIIRYIRENK